jgi:hypothetical protein
MNYTLYDPSKNITRDDIIKNLLDNISKCTMNELILENFYNPALRLSSDPTPTVILDNNNFVNITTSLNFVCKKNSDGIDYANSYFTFKKIDPNDPAPRPSQGLSFHTFSDMISYTSSNYDVLTFYLTFILVIGNVIRNIISGEETKIILSEMPEPKVLINLCEGIKISRYRFEFDREEYLYYVLIDYMRSPEILKIMTKSSVKVLRERKERELKEEHS